MNFFSSAALLLVFATLTATRDVSYEVSEVQVKLVAKPKSSSSSTSTSTSPSTSPSTSSSSPTIAQVARESVTQETPSQDCCPYPVNRANAIVHSSLQTFKCSEPVSITCSDSGNQYIEVAIAEDGKNPITGIDIINVGFLSVTVSFECNTTAKKWMTGSNSTQYSQLACAYKTMTGEWTYGY